MMGMLVRVTDSNGKKLAPTQGDPCDLKNHDDHWRRFFNINKFETKERRFGGRISSDGVSVSVYLDRDQACVLSTKEGEWDPLRIGNEKGGLKVLYSGVDPGFSDVVTIAHSGTLEGLKDGPDRSVHATVTSYSSSRYAEASKQKLSNRRTSKWNLQTPYSANVEKAADKSSALGISTFIRSYLKVLRPLLEHRAKMGYRNMRFLRYVWKHKAIHEICDLIAPKNKYNVTAYGDWSGGHGTPVKRRWAGPQQEIKRELHRRRNVLFWSMWEYRTSITCHRTWRSLTNMRALSWKYDKEAGKQVLGDTKSRVHKILHCRSSVGVKGHQGGGTWNRDANASRNILMLLMLVVLGVERPKEFTPAVSAPRRRKQSTKGASLRAAKSLSSAH